MSSTSWGTVYSRPLKTSTCILFDPNGNFSKFGFEAEEMYSELTLEQQHQNWYFFRRFKMELYGTKAIKRDLEIKDLCGKYMAAMKVFSAGINFLKDHMQETCKEQLNGISADNIRWVLTIPAIWSDSAKQFMREAAERAGISSDQLQIALEPEAASLYCRHILRERDPTGDVSALKSGANCLVLDAGGGIVDITVHEVQLDGSLREKHKATGGDLGGVKVDDAFGILLSEIIGKSAYDKFCHYKTCDMLELFHNFEEKKMTLKSDGEEIVSVKIPMSLDECCKSETGNYISEQVDSCHKFRNDISVIASSRLRIKPHIIRNMIKEVTNNIVDHLEKLLSHEMDGNVTSILMVGGFSESNVLQDIIKSRFEKQNVEVIVPPDAGLAVLKGAAIYGHEPRRIKSRICKLTYGIRTSCEFQRYIHPDSKRVVRSDGSLRCKDIFDIHIRKGDSVNVGEPQASRTYNIAETDESGTDFQVWISHELDPMYITDERCQKLGSLRINRSYSSRRFNGSVNIQMTFGGTELEVEATDECTGKSVQASFDFL